MTNTTTSRAVRIAAGNAALALAGLGLTGCDSLPDLSYADYEWSTATQARDSDEGFRVRDLVPDDATDVTLRIDEREFGAQFEWQSEAGITADYCEPQPLDRTSEMNSSWWPDTVPSEGWVCGWWEVFELDGSYYAWDTREQDDA